MPHASLSKLVCCQRSEIYFNSDLQILGRKWQVNICFLSLLRLFAPILIKLHSYTLFLIKKMIFTFIDAKHGTRNSVKHSWWVGGYIYSDWRFSCSSMIMTKDIRPRDRSICCTYDISHITGLYWPFCFCFLIFFWKFLESRALLFI